MIFTIGFVRMRDTFIKRKMHNYVALISYVEEGRRATKWGSTSSEGVILFATLFERGFKILACLPPPPPSAWQKLPNSPIQSKLKLVFE